jgi:hypothetical protein
MSIDLDNRSEYASVGPVEVPAVEPRSRSLGNRFAFVVVTRLARILLPLGVGFGEFAQTAKSAFVAAAAHRIRGRGDRVSTARVAALTGLSRADVAVLRRNPPTVATVAALQRTERVMHGWFNDGRFVDSVGSPRVLPLTGHDSFDELVRTFSGDIPRRAVLDELLAGGMVAMTSHNHVRPLRRHHAHSTTDAIDLESITFDAAIFLDAAASTGASDKSMLRRVSVAFPNGALTAATRRNIALRTERFLEGISEYLHSESMSQQYGDPNTEAVIHVLVTKSESSDDM